MPWAYEIPFWKTVQIKSREGVLRGRPDYALWYGAQANLETNLGIVEKKTRDELGEAERQLLGYLGASIASYYKRITEFPGFLHIRRRQRVKERWSVLGGPPVDSLREDIDTILGTLYDMTQMRVPEGEVVIYDAFGGVSHCPLWYCSSNKVSRYA